MANDPNLEPILNLMDECFIDESSFNRFMISSFSSMSNKLQTNLSLSDKMSQFVRYVHTDRNISKILDNIRTNKPAIYEEYRTQNIDVFEIYESQAVKNGYRETEAINELEQYLQFLSLEQLQPIYQSCRPDKADRIVNNFNEIATQLNRLPSGNETYRDLIKFVVKVKEKYSSLDLDLENWLSKYGALFGGYNKSITLSRPNSIPPLNLSESSLLIAVERIKVDELKIQAWFWSYQSCLCIQEPEIIMIDANPDKYQKLSNKLNDLIQKSNVSMKNIGSEDLRIEFFMPIRLLKELNKIDFCIERIKIKLFDDDETVEIGKQYPVIFRLAERLKLQHQASKGDWKRRWENLTSRLIIPYNDSNIQDKLSQYKTIGIILNSMSNYEDFLSLILYRAVPIALWSRCDLETKSSLEIKSSRKIKSSLNEINRILKKQRVVKDFQQLPREIKNERNVDLGKTEHIGHYICLLWDDPERMPPDPQKLENALMAI